MKAKSPVLLSAEKLTKSYGGFLALDSVDFELLSGEVHVLLGENGAGKSTLIAILSGAALPTRGHISVENKRVGLPTVRRARDLGISAVFQEFSLVPQMTVAENIFLGAECVSRGVLNKQRQRGLVDKILADLGFNLPAHGMVDKLSRAEQQMVEIAKAFRSNLKVLILDEPTASLTRRETEQLFVLLEKLKKKGVGIVYVTHRMEEVRKIGDRITVLRDGRLIKTVPVASSSDEEIIRLLTGRDIGSIFPRHVCRPGEVVFETRKLTTADGSVKDVSVVARRGEIVGMAGLAGSGKSELMRAAYGAQSIKSGAVLLKGGNVTGDSIKNMIDKGFLYVPPDRRNEGLFMMRPCRENMTINILRKISAGALIRKRAEAELAGSLSKRLNILQEHIEKSVHQLSGGNQQRVMLSRSVAQPADLLVFDEPTVGVDVASRAVIYELMTNLCEAGASVVLVSSDLPEILNLSNRVYVFCNGVVRVELAGDDIREENVYANFFWDSEAA